MKVEEEDDFLEDVFDKEVLYLHKAQEDVILDMLLHGTFHVDFMVVFHVNYVNFAYFHTIKAKEKDFGFIFIVLNTFNEDDGY